MVMTEISAAQAKELIAKNKKNKDFIILDVRTAEEFAQEHLQGAVNIDIHQDNFPEEIEELDHHKTYLVHCKSGARSRAACEFMTTVGFTQVYNIVGWMCQKKSTTTG